MSDSRLLLNDLSVDGLNIDTIQSQNDMITVKYLPSGETIEFPKT